MKHTNNVDNQYGSLDPEKVYFIEKFSYLINKIDSGYSIPVQEALFDRISKAVVDFKEDLPNIVRDLEINRLRSLSTLKKSNIVNHDTFRTDKKIKARAAEATKIISDKINLAERKRQQVKSSQPEVLYKPYSDRPVIEKEIEIPDELSAQHLVNIKKSQSPILKPSEAVKVEQKRLERIRAMQQKKDFLNTRAAEKQPAKKQEKKDSDKNLTEWERRWHKYDSDIVGDGFNGYS